MPKVPMKALKSFLLYSTRRLQAGDTFEAKSEAHAELHELAGQGKRTRIPGEVPAPPAETAAKIEEATKPRRRARRTTKK